MYSTARSIIDTINQYAERFGDEVYDYEVFLEQCDEKDKIYKRGPQKWDISVFKGDWEEYERFKSLGGVGISTEKKEIYIDVNY